MYTFAGPLNTLMLPHAFQLLHCLTHRLIFCGFHRTTGWRKLERWGWAWPNKHLAGLPIRPPFTCNSMRAPTRTHINRDPPTGYHHILPDAGLSKSLPNIKAAGASQTGRKINSSNSYKGVQRSMSANSTSCCDTRCGLAALSFEGLYSVRDKLGTGL